jgi:DNA topoisomerase-1
VAKKSLVVVESPTKVKTIQKYLDKTFVVKASMGHVRDLPKSKLGVNEKTFAPQYVAVKSKQKTIDDLQRAARNSHSLYIATDPDREGEAIGWHLAEMLGVNKKRVHRVMFNEITKRAVQAAFERPGRIDPNKVDAQQARRVLDRLVGYKLSPLLWEKVRRGLSAGRVQSVALRLIVDREREISAFVPVEYWSLHARLAGARPPEFVATLREVDGEKVALPTEAATAALMERLAGARYTVRAVNRGERRRNPAPPFITSTLQQEAGRKLHFTAKKTMLLAQQLYEGVEIGAEGALGLITYMRTDSTRVAAGAQTDARAWIGDRFGAPFVPDSPPVYRAKKNAQDAHEAIRPTDIAREPRQLARNLTRDQLALYRLIWERFMASQMRPAVYDTVSVDIEAMEASQPSPADAGARPGPGICVFRVQGATLRFPGFTAIYVESRDEEVAAEDDAEIAMPSLEVGDGLTLLGLEPKQHFTQPAPRFTEASLVKTLEERGIGRPSTYATIISTIQQRDYVRREKGTLYPTELGIQVTDLLLPFFPDIMDVEFTSQLEEELDRIEDGEVRWAETVRGFYTRFAEDLVRAGGKMENLKKGTETGQACPECGKPLLERWGRFGKFLACSAYPECRFTQNLGTDGRGKPEDEPTSDICDLCGKPMVIKHGRYGKFVACSGYPECKKTKPLSIGVACAEPGCGGQLVRRRSKRGRAFYSCSNYPTCKFVVWQRPVPQPCPNCGAPFLTERTARGGKTVLQCIREECGHRQEVAQPVA